MNPMTWIPANQTVDSTRPPRGPLVNTLLAPFRWFAGIVHWFFGLASVILGLALLATIPLVQLGLFSACTIPRGAVRDIYFLTFVRQSLLVPDALL